MRVRHQQCRGTGVRTSSVQQDWRAWLPANKAEIYSTYTRHVESVYNMFGVALNDALELRRTGKLGKSAEAVYTIQPLCKRFVHPLLGLLRALADHAKHYRIVPNTLSLSATNFQGERAQRTARLNEILTFFLLSQRSQFLHKITALHELVCRLEEDFRVAAEELGMGTSLSPQADWRVVDIAHYDLNTCLREAEILLKSFLISIPDDQLPVFQKTADDHMRPSDPSHRSVSLILPRRMAAGRGK